MRTNRGALVVLCVLIAVNGGCGMLEVAGGLWINATFNLVAAIFDGVVLAKVLA